MNLFDGLTAAYAVGSAVRGFRLGAAEEVGRLVRLAISVLAGCGLFALVAKGASAASDVVRSAAGSLGFAAGVGVIYVGARKLKRASVSFLQRHLAGKYSRLIGGAIGLVRALTMVSALVAFLQLSPWILGVKGIMGDSAVWLIVGSVAHPESGAQVHQAGDHTVPGQVSPSPSTS